MAEKRILRQTDVMLLDQLQWVVAESSEPEPIAHPHPARRSRKVNPELKAAVKRLIAYFKDENTRRR
jgi:hypothetical protein